MFAGTEFEGVFDIAEISNFSEDERLEYEASMKYDDIYNATIDCAKREGREEGITQGMTKGMAKGIAQGIMQTAKKLKSMGLSIAQINKATGLSKKEILALN